MYHNFRWYLKIKHKETYELSNIHDKKDKESEIVKKYLRWINLYEVFKDKCNNDIEMENSTGNLSIINKADFIQ